MTLMLSRREGEGLVFRTADGPMVIQIAEIRKCGVIRLAIDAPRTVLVARSTPRGEIENPHRLVPLDEPGEAVHG